MSSGDTGLLVERVNLRIIVAALLAGAVGAILLYVASNHEWWSSEGLRLVCEHLGALLTATVVLALLWESAGKRAFLDEILVKAGIAKELQAAGIVQVTGFFHQEVRWKELFASVQKLDIFFAYGQTWRNAHRHELTVVASRRGARVRVVLPDPQHETTVSELAWRFNYTSEHLRGLIKEAEAHFLELRATAAEHGASVDIWYLPGAPVFSSYRFDGTGLLVIYTHRRERSQVPTMVVTTGGSLYDFLRSEFDSMVKDGGLARKST